MRRVIAYSIVRQPRNAEAIIVRSRSFSFPFFFFFFFAVRESGITTNKEPRRKKMFMGVFSGTMGRCDFLNDMELG